ncbi:SsrA-binding protein SmpB [Synergistaceae bacterium OttesenSCG-928-I11]|nr:SsrA-binding protein SmpB [Synergistaceae bacterium OttesenSCG-928-I11]
MADAQDKKREDQTVARNRKARHEYFVLDSMEVGIVLSGTEIKSVRNGQVNLRDGFARIENGELWLHNVHISPYEKGTYYNKEPMRPRKLLAHKSQILKLFQKTREKGLTLIPLAMYIKEGKRAKVELALAKGKQQHDKRDSIAERDADREISRKIRESGKREY